METDRFKKYVIGKAEGILFMDHRPYFILPDGTKAHTNAGQTICLIAYGKTNLESLVNSNLGPVFIEYK